MQFAGFRKAHKAAIFHARNELTKKVRAFSLSDNTFFKATERGWDYCAGPCKCKVELDGTCPAGWPARVEAALVDVR